MSSALQNLNDKERSLFKQSFAMQILVLSWLLRVILKLQVLVRTWFCTRIDYINNLWFLNFESILFTIITYKLL